MALCKLCQQQTDGVFRVNNRTARLECGACTVAHAPWLLIAFRRTASATLQHIYIYRLMHISKKHKHYIYTLLKTYTHTIKRISYITSAIWPWKFAIKIVASRGLWHTRVASLCLCGAICSTTKLTVFPEFVAVQSQQQRQHIQLNSSKNIIQISVQKKCGTIDVVWFSLNTIFYYL